MQEDGVVRDGGRGDNEVGAAHQKALSTELITQAAGKRPRSVIDRQLHERGQNAGEIRELSFIPGTAHDLQLDETVRSNAPVGEKLVNAGGQIRIGSSAK